MSECERDDKTEQFVVEILEITADMFGQREEQLVQCVFTLVPI